MQLDLYRRLLTEITHEEFVCLPYEQYAALSLSFDLLVSLSYIPNFLVNKSLKLTYIAVLKDTKARLLN